MVRRALECAAASRQMEAPHAIALAETLMASMAWGATHWLMLRAGTLAPKRKQTTPLLIPSLKNITNVATGAAFNAALTANGDCLTWGLGEVGQLGRSVRDVKVNDEYDLDSLRNDHLTPKKVDFGEKVKVLGCGAYHLLAATELGLLSCGLEQLRAARGRFDDGSHATCFSERFGR